MADVWVEEGRWGLQWEEESNISDELRRATNKRNTRDEHDPLTRDTCYFGMDGHAWPDPADEHQDLAEHEESEHVGRIRMPYTDFNSEEFIKRPFDEYYPEEDPRSTFVYAGPVLSPKQFLHALSIFATKPEILDGRIKSAYLVIDCAQKKPEFYNKEGKIILDNPAEIPQGLYKLLDKPFRPSVFTELEDLNISSMNLWRSQVALNGEVVTEVKETWDFAKLLVTFDYISSEGNKDLANWTPNLHLEASVWGPLVSFKVKFNNVKRLAKEIKEKYRTTVLPRVINWAGGSDYPNMKMERNISSNYVCNEPTYVVGDKLNPIDPVPSPLFYDVEGPVPSPQAFLHAISILASKPQVVNKRIKGAEVILDHLVWYPKFYKEVDGQLVLLKITDVPEDLFLDLAKPFTSSVLNSFDDYGIDRIVLRRAVLGKSFQEYIVLEDWDLRHKRVLIVYPDAENGVSSSECPSLCFEAYMMGDSTFRIMIGFSGRNQINNCDSLFKSMAYYHEFVLPKVVSWAKLEISDVGDSLIPSTSLIEVPVQAYYKTYELLKQGYFNRLKEVWTETTDPLKFIPEELGIAAYIYCFIQKTNQVEPPHFVDLGCGNGLLTLFLTQFFDGYGFDVRARRLWAKLRLKDLSPERKTIEPDLRVLSFNPFVDHIKYEQNQWLIGNHCDELTPWVPVLARNSHAIGFILIPCCFYDFNGKFQPRTTEFETRSPRSRYEKYLRYIFEIGQKCGYFMFVDKLRIPSTKRVCIIGVDATRKPLNEVNELLEEGMRYAQSKVSSCPKSDYESYDENDRAMDQITFKPREAIERVNNCTKLDKVLVARIINKIFKRLVQRSGDFVCKIGYVRPFDVGIPYMLSEVSTWLSRHEREQIKAQGKGLQTLIKNHHQIFLITNSRVRIRCPAIARNSPSHKDIENNARPKTQECFFHQNHPDGCPLEAKDCKFRHSDRGIMARTRKLCAIL